MNPRTPRAVALALALLSGLAAAPVTAQDELGPEAEAALAVVEALFDGMRAKDADAMAELFADGARLVTTGEGQDGAPRIAVQEISGWLDAVRGAEAYLDERIWDPVVQVSDRLATVWVKYALYVDERFSHCGVDAFSLVKSAAGWRVIQVVDTRRREDCWHPPS